MSLFYNYDDPPTGDNTTNINNDTLIDTVSNDLGGGNNLGDTDVGGNTTSQYFKDSYFTPNITSSENGYYMVMNIDHYTGTFSFSKPTIVDTSGMHSDISKSDINDSFYGNYDSVKNPYKNIYVVDYNIYGKQTWEVNNKDETLTIYQSEKDWAPSHYEFDDALNAAKDEFRKNKSTADKGDKDDDDDKTNDDEWEFILGKLSFEFGNEFEYSTKTVVKQAQLILNTTGALGDLMAGGSLYNTSFAGGRSFNVTGQISATEFLGVQNRNINYMFQAKEGFIGEHYRILNVTSGQGTEGSGTNVFRIIHNAKLRNASGENFIVEESSFLGDTGTKTVKKDTRNDSLEDVWNDIVNWFDSL